jgi:hypothetical protein
MYLKGTETTAQEEKPSYYPVFLVAFAIATVFAMWPLFKGERKRKPKKTQRYSIIML